MPTASIERNSVFIDTHTHLHGAEFDANRGYRRDEDSRQ
jgi:hypothetical protein